MELVAGTIVVVPASNLKQTTEDIDPLSVGKNVPPIIFLDEPTASLDAIATEQIKASIDAIKKDRTVIIISHSISQIIDSDVIYALKEGRVEQSGDPESR